MVDQPAKDAEFYLDEKNNLRIQTDQRGRKISSSSLYQIVIQSLVKVDFSEKELPITTEEAKVTAQNLETIKEKIEPLLEKSLLVQHKNNTWELEPEDKLNYITIKKIEGNLNPALNNKTFNAYAEKIAREINVLPRGEVTKETEDGKVLEFEIIEKGEEVDVNAFRKEFEQALLNNSEKITVTTIPTDNSSDLEKYGILALLGRGESDYSGSIPSRIHNLTLAAERASGALVPPGEVFSLNEAVGPINGATGYNSAWVIANGRTVLGSGGGVCQTSTTMFRAALNSGLPVVERHPHAYRVSYYENDMPLGFDASIYQPALDFKFKNDTPNYVLVQAETIPEENKLAFRIYGTPDGRKVEITEPNIYGVSPAPAPRYEETDDLPKGTTKQVDFAAPGGTSVFSRTVTKNGEVLFEETYKSVYRPWQAIFLVGTKTD
jgi:vancomycin resistance protein YoaR